MLMLEHKQQPYRRVDLLTGLHPVLARLHGFTAGGEIRTAGGRRTPGLLLGDLLATVPGLAADDRRISTNHAIARFLDEQHPERPLFPGDPGRRAAVEEAERWANEELQMDARRILAGALLHDPWALSRSAADGRMGYLLYRHALTRRLITPILARGAFASSLQAERELLAQLPATLDRIDAWIADGVLSGTALNSADFMIAPSLALILYRPDVLPLFKGRPALDLVDRLLPEQAEMEAGRGPSVPAASCGRGGR